MKGGVRKITPFFVPIDRQHGRGDCVDPVRLQGPTWRWSGRATSRNQQHRRGRPADRVRRPQTMLAGWPESTISALGLAGFCAARGCPRPLPDRVHRARQPPDVAPRDGIRQGKGRAYTPPPPPPTPPAPPTPTDITDTSSLRGIQRAEAAPRDRHSHALFRRHNG